MNDGVVKRQQRRYMVYSLVAMTLLFGLFGVIVFAQLHSSLFYRVDRELERARQSVEQTPAFVDQQLAFRFDEAALSDRENRKRSVLPMRVQALVRDSGGTILNTQYLGRWYWENDLAQIEFHPEELDEIIPFRLSGGTALRSLTFVQHSGDGTDYYVQLLCNVDGEQGMVDGFARILVTCVAVFVLLALIASHLLSRKSMGPLLRAWRRQTEFVADASHELRTPLTVIQNQLEGLLTAPDATILDKADSIAVSLSETRRLVKLTGNLMTLARADSAATQLEKERFGIDTLIADVARPFAERCVLEEKTLTLELDCPGDIVADKGRLHQLLVILLDNAIKYSRPGDSIRVTTALRDGKLDLAVSDTGIGISDENRARVFDRFYREDKARSQDGGMGLGLSIADWIVSAHGGTIRVLPATGEGTVLQVRLPRG